MVSRQYGLREAAAAPWYPPRIVRRGLAILVLLVTSVGCGGGSRRGAEEPSDRAGPGAGAASPLGGGASGEAIAARAPSCPERYGAPGPRCDGRGVAPTCEYPEGSCYCGEPRECSGAVRAPVPPQWVCVPREPPCPEPGGPCEGDAVCGPWCCGMGVACENGRWVGREFPCPP